MKEGKEYKIETMFHSYNKVMIFHQGQETIGYNLEIPVDNVEEFIEQNKQRLIAYIKEGEKASTPANQTKTDLYNFNWSVIGKIIE